MDVLRVCAKITRHFAALRPLSCAVLLLIAPGVYGAPPEPKRIISVAPSFTEILYDLGLGNRVIATTLYCDYPPEASKTEKIGDVLNPNVEKIISLKPDLVLCGDWKWNVPDKLRAAGITVVEVPDAESVQDIFNRFILIGEKTGKKDEALESVDSMKAQIQTIRARAVTKPVRKVYVEIDAGNWTIGGSSYLNEILQIAGARNVFSERSEPYLTVTMESIVARDPDLLLSLSRTREEYKSLPAWRTLRAVQNDRIIDKSSVDWNALTHQGSRLISGIEDLEKTIDRITHADH